MWEDNSEWTFSLVEALLMIMDSYFVQKQWLKCFIDRFVSYKHAAFPSQDINWWTGVVWIIVMFLSAVWTLILTAPIHRWSIGEQVM